MYGVFFQEVNAILNSTEKKVKSRYGTAIFLYNNQLICLTA